MLLTKISIILLPMEIYCKNFRDIQKGNCCFIKSKFEYLSTLNLYLLISAKKQIFAYFQYLVCLNKVLQSLNFHIPCRGKVTKFITSNYIFSNKNFDPILSNTNYSFRAYHISLNLMSHYTDVISADVSNFGHLAIFVMSKDFLS